MAQSVVEDRSGESEAVWETVVSVVAETTGRDPLSLDPIYDAVDQDALDALFSGVGSDRSPERVTFTYEGCDVTVAGGGVQVEATERTTQAGGVA